MRQSGYTDALVLEASVYWWASLGDASSFSIGEASSDRYPEERTGVVNLRADAAAQRIFFSVMAAEAMPWCATAPYASFSTAAVESVHHSCRLSRVGRTIFSLEAQWGEVLSKQEKPRTVYIRNPFSGERISLRVLRFPSSTPIPSLAALAEEDRVRISHRAWVAVPTSLSPQSCVSQSCTDWQRLALLHSVALEQAEKTYREWLLHSIVDTLDKKPTAIGSSTSSCLSFLVNGPDGVGKKRFVQTFFRHLHPTGVVSLASTTQRLTIHFVIEKRSIDFSSLLALEASEVLETIRHVLQPVPILSDAMPCGTSHLTLPVLWVTLLHVDLLLRYSENELVAIGAFELLHRLDALAQRPLVQVSGERCEWHAPVVLWCLAQTVPLQPSYGPDSPASLDATGALLNRWMSEGACSRIDLSSPSVDAKHHLLRRAGVRWPGSDEALQALTTDALLQYVTCGADAAPDSGEKDAGDGSGALHTSSSSPVSSGEWFKHLFGLDHVVLQLERHLIWPLTHLSMLHQFSVPCVKGALLTGASGCGKTTLLTALARRLQTGALEKGSPSTEQSLHVMVRDGLALIEKEVGRSEQNIAELFHEARSHAPTVLFLDNLEALAPPRGRTPNESSEAFDRTLSTLLVEMDGLRSSSGAGASSNLVVVVASASSLDALDPAVYRAGRMDIHLHLSPSSLAVIRSVFIERISKVIQSHSGISSRDEEESEILAVLDPILETQVDQRLERMCAHENLNRKKLQVLRHPTELHDESLTNTLSWEASSAPSAAIVLSDIRDVTMALLQAWAKLPHEGQNLEDFLASRVRSLSDAFASLSFHN